MTMTIIGATGRVGSAVVRRLLETGQPVRAYVRDAGKARRIFGQPNALEIYQGRLDEPEDLAAGLGDASCIFMAMGSMGSARLSTRSPRTRRAGTSTTSRPWGQPGHSGWSSATPGPATAPALVTVFIGSNDILHHDLRMNLAMHYEALIEALPAGSSSP
jgi:NAD(P)H-binding